MVLIFNIDYGNNRMDTITDNTTDTINDYTTDRITISYIYSCIRNNS